MALGPPFMVRVEKQPECSFGQTMSEVRLWLDHRRIEPLRFKPLANAESGFEVSFNSEAEAILFEHAFRASTPGYPSFANAGGASSSPAPGLVAC
jgi:hypothetical protein